MQLLNDRVLVQKDEVDENVTQSGIFLASTSDLLTKGEVVEVGHGLLTQTGERVALTVQKGDRILFSSVAGVDYEGNRLINESDVVAIL